MKTYRNNWEPCKLVVNFNQKQWRQDFASFIVNKLNWFDARVTRSKLIEDKSVYKEAIREFEIYTAGGETFKVQYTNKNEIISSSNDLMVKDYLAKKGINR